MEFRSSVPAEFGEAVVFDTEMVSDFVDDGAGNLAAEFGAVGEFVEERAAIDGDAVGETVEVAGAFGKRRAGVETEDGFVGRYAEFIEEFIAGVVLDDDLDVVEVRPELGGDHLQRFGDDLLKFAVGHSHGFLRGEA